MYLWDDFFRDELLALFNGVELAKNDLTSPRVISWHIIHGVT